MAKANRHEFRAVIDGMDLAPEMVERLDRAVQSAVMAELSQFDLGKRAIANSPLVLLGRTRGIWIRDLDLEQLKQIGFND
jgi:hypothetical protein